MTNPSISFSFAGLPGGLAYCFTNPQRFALDIVAGLTGNLPGTFAGFVISETEPPVDQRDGLWFRLNPGGSPGGRFYYFFNGQWVSPNPEEPSGEARRLFVGVESALWSYDGGSGEDPAIVVPSYAGGAMWEADILWAGRSPMGVGDIPNANPAKTLAIVEDFGAGARLNLEQEVAPHTHKVWPANDGDGNADKNWSAFDAGGESCAGTTSFPIQPNDNCPLLTLLVANAPEYTATQETAPIVHPVRGCFIAKRTARVAYLA